MGPLCRLSLHCVRSFFLHVSTQSNSMPGASILVKAIGYLIGTVSLIAWSALAIWHGYLWRPRSPALRSSIAQGMAASR